MRVGEMIRYNKLLSITITLVLSFVCNADAISEDATIVNTPLGEVKGYLMKTQEGRVVKAFTAIPYAEPPIGELRFQAPEPIKPWKGTLNASKPTPACVQRNPYTRQIEIVGQEDCLYLNIIYTPTTKKEMTKKDKLLPIMVFLHGGGWMCGDSSVAMYGPEYLLDHPVILVTLNYRLGPLGFLSTRDEYCPGNNGLKDQQEGFRLIQKIIESFGGDKNAVTLFGESAGGASVHFHMLSKTSAGLFHRAISESGTALVPWAEAPPGEALRNAFQLAKYLKCPQAPSEQMLKCLRAKDSYQIIDTEFDIYAWDYEPMTPFKAVVEPDLPGAFLTKRGCERCSRRAVADWPDQRRRLFEVRIISNDTRYREFTSGFDRIAPVTFYYDNSPYAHSITKKIKEVYLMNLSTDYMKRGILRLYTDSYFAYPMVEAVEQTLTYTKSPIYLYELAYRGSNSFSQIFGDPTGNHGVCHADELMYLFPIHFLSNTFSSKDNEIGKLIRTMWTNFATSGDPNKPVSLPAKWEAATIGNNLKYLEIGKELTMKTNIAARSRFWSDMPLWHKLYKNMNACRLFNNGVGSIHRIYGAWPWYSLYLSFYIISAMVVN